MLVIRGDLVGSMGAIIPGGIGFMASRIIIVVAKIVLQSVGQLVAGWTYLAAYASLACVNPQVL